MFKQISALFKKPPAAVLAQAAIEESQRQMLHHESVAAYHTKVAEYYKGNIFRLSKYLREDAT